MTGTKFVGNINTSKFCPKHFLLNFKRQAVGHEFLPPSTEGRSHAIMLPQIRDFFLRVQFACLGLALAWLWTGAAGAHKPN